MSQLDNFLNRVKLILSHYGITYNDEIGKFRNKGDNATYYIQTSTGIIFVTVDLTTFQGQIEFNTLFQSSKLSINVDEFNMKFPMLQQYHQAFETDKEIFNAFVTQHDNDYTMKKTYGYLLDLLDVSLVFNVSIDDVDINENNFIIRYNTLQSCSKMLMLDEVYYLQFENTYDFNYVDGNLVYDGDYKQLHQEVSAAYNLNDPELKFKNFKDLAQLTLMKVY
jgi:hypothetical protein